MKFIDNQGITDPRINLAIEEYALRKLSSDEDYLLFYVNGPSIIIGKNQNTVEEINNEYVEQRGIHVVRRLSGGGAVYHDLGNLNFSFITKDDGQSFHNYKKFTEPVVAALHELGVEAELTGRNDIQVGERKISGNAQFATKGRMFSHGTLMLQTDLDVVTQALKVNKAKIESKGIKSIRSRVANIAEFLNTPITMAEFRSHLLSSIFKGGSVEEYVLTDQDWIGINEISRERYSSWDWNYGKSPGFNVSHYTRFEGVGTIDLRLQVDKGIIQSVKIFGDFFGTDDVQELESTLTGVPFSRPEIDKALGEVDLKRYFGSLDRELFLSLFTL
jgi:lipoate---protein ligase